MLRMKVVIQKQRVVRILLQVALRSLNVLGYVDEVALKAISKPTVSSAIVVEQKNSDGMTLDRVGAEPKLT